MSLNEKDKMADTPITRPKKRAMDETPPKAGEPYKLLSLGGTVTLASPPEMQDPKKRLTAENEKEGEEGESTKATIPATPNCQGEGHIDTNMAAIEVINKKPSEVEGGNKTEGTDGGNADNKLLPDTTEGKGANHGRAPTR